MNQADLLSCLRLDSFIAFDFETTGLQVETDRPIEVAAILFKDGKPSDRYSTLINPMIPISDMIADITGITNEMVSSAPKESEVVDELFDFIGNSPIVAHNTPFDVSFLQAMAERHKKDFVERQYYDTLTLSRAFLFFQPAHNLSAVSEFFNLSSEGAHRAEKDTENCGEVFVEIVHEIASYGLDVISNIVSFLQPFDVYNKDLFINLANHLASKGEMKNGLVSSKIDKPSTENIFFHESSEHLSSTNSDDVFGEDGMLSKTLNSYEHRSNQILFSDYVDGITSSPGGIGVVEAGTGLGKSMAYLYPAIKYTHDESDRGPIILSCYTKHLQDQLFNNDLPKITKATNAEVRAVVMKGRNNYICKTRLNWLIKSADKMLDGNEAMNLLPLLVWLEHTTSGDLDECPGFSNGFTFRLMGMVQSERGFCTSSICSSNDGCFFGPLRRIAFQANLIIVNHALLISDGQSKIEGEEGQGFLPEYNAVIIDEAHNLPKAAYQQLTLTLDQRSLNYALDRIDPKHSHSVRWNNKIRALAGLHPQFELSRSSLTNYVENARGSIKSFFDKMTSYAIHHFDKDAKYSTKIILNDLEEYFTPLDSELNALKKSIHDIRNHLRKIREDLLDIDETKEDFLELHQLFDRGEGSLTEMIVLIDAITANQNKDYVYWYEGVFKMVSGSTQLIVTVNMSPVEPGNDLAKSIFKPNDYCILTSATLRTNLSFDYFLNRVGLNSFEFDDISSKVFESPFSYSDQVTYYQYSGNDGQRPDIIAKTILHCHKKFNKRMMVLFTSRAQLDNTHQILKQISRSEHLPIFAQKRQTSRLGLIRGMGQVSNGILLGTNAFWEGVDLPGDLLEILIIIKMPFDVPTEPTVKAYGSMVESQGGNSFMDYALPESVIRFRQGFGRLIRTQYDDGIFIVMDDRIINKRYGIAFSETIPVQMQVFQRFNDI